MSEMDAAAGSASGPKRETGSRAAKGEAHCQCSACASDRANSGRADVAEARSVTYTEKGFRAGAVHSSAPSNGAESPCAKRPPSDRNTRSGTRRGARPMSARAQRAARAKDERVQTMMRAAPPPGAMRSAMHLPAMLPPPAHPLRRPSHPRPPPPLTAEQHRHPLPAPFPNPPSHTSPVYPTSLQLFFATALSLPTRLHRLHCPSIPSPSSALEWPSAPTTHTCLIDSALCTSATCSTLTSPTGSSPAVHPQTSALSTPTLPSFSQSDRTTTP